MAWHSSLPTHLKPCSQCSSCKICKTRSYRLHSKIGMAHSVCWVEAGTCVEKIDSIDSHSKIWQQAV